MSHPIARVVAALVVVLGSSLPLTAQMPDPGARLLRAETALTLNGAPIGAGASATPLGEAANLQTSGGRAVIALKHGGTLVLGTNSAARVHANRGYNFNRIEILAGSAVLSTTSGVAVVVCGTSATLSSGGVFRFDVLAAERADGSQRCRMRVHEGAASTPGASVSYVLRSGQEMVMNARAGDMIPVMPLAAGALDDLDRWAREQAAAPR